MSNLRFKTFLLNENKVHLGQRMGDILNSIHDLEENGESMGNRQLMKSAETIVNQIRRILHTHWAQNELKYLEILQKIGVAIMKSIEEKSGDLIAIISSAGQEVEKTLSELGVPQNNLGVDKSAEDEPLDSMSEPKGKNQKKVPTSKSEVPASNLPQGPPQPDLPPTAANMAGMA